MTNNFNNIPKQNEDMEHKPKLYQGSPFSDLKKIEPKNKGKRDNNEGVAIFTTPSKAFASMFLVRYYDNQGIKGKNKDIFYTIIWDDEIKEKIQNQGGSIYEVDNSNFSFDENKGMGENEWTSKESANILNEEKFNNALQTMINNGVVVYFIDEKDKEKVLDKNTRFEFLKNIKSQNEILKK